ncbi:hypothetical protein [Priestia megaterium]|uniref:hypothetical protein n=1 Tax=Priestia megaterium TaxID=1404 RepID=UPI000BF2C2FE|nr:hypothetical protein [Priestia megaterium]PFQ82047.1 hypothetical protein COK11_16335 [Priestia megaterium]
MNHISMGALDHGMTNEGAKFLEAEIIGFDDWKDEDTVNEKVIVIVRATEIVKDNFQMTVDYKDKSMLTDERVTNEVNEALEILRRDAPIFFNLFAVYPLDSPL